jgi:outer membrane biosynthesis protein TonB
MSRTSRFASSLALLLLSLGCGPDKPAAEPDADLPPPAEEPPRAVEATNAGTATADPASGESTQSAAVGEPSPAASGAQETRTAEVIAQIIRDNRKPFRDCYEKGKQKIPELEGTLTLFFVLGPKGDVKKAELNQERSNIVEPVVVDCAIAALKGMKFPPSSRGMESTVNYPFDFKR